MGPTDSIALGNGLAQVTSHYLNQCWEIADSFDVTGPQKLNQWFFDGWPGHKGLILRARTSSRYILIHLDDA